MLQRFMAGINNVGIARQIPIGIEEARQRVTEIAGGGHFGPVGERRQAGWFLSSLWHAGSASRRNLTMSRQTLLTTASAKCIGHRTLSAFVGNGGVRTHARRNNEKHRHPRDLQERGLAPICPTSAELERPVFQLLGK